MSISLLNQIEISTEYVKSSCYFLPNVLEYSDSIIHPYILRGKRGFYLWKKSK